MDGRAINAQIIVQAALIGHLFSQTLHSSSLLIHVEQLLALLMGWDRGAFLEGFHINVFCVATVKKPTLSLNDQATRRLEHPKRIYVIWELCVQILKYRRE